MQTYSKGTYSSLFELYKDAADKAPAAATRLFSSELIIEQLLDMQTLLVALSTHLR